VLEALDLRDVRVPVDDSLAVLESRGETGLPPGPRAGVVNHPDPHAADLHDPLLRQHLFEPRLVHVPDDALDGRADLPQLLQKLHRHEVAPVQDELGAREQADALARQRPRAAWEMRIGDDGDPGQEAATGSGATVRGSRRK
jgi:hypothetical protein